MKATRKLTEVERGLWCMEGGLTSLENSKRWSLIWEKRPNAWNQKFNLPVSGLAWHVDKGNPIDFMATFFKEVFEHRNLLCEFEVEIAQSLVIWPRKLLKRQRRRDWWSFNKLKWGSSQIWQWRGQREQPNSKMSEWNYVKLGLNMGSSMQPHSSSPSTVRINTSRIIRRQRLSPAGWSNPLYQCNNPEECLGE